MHLNSNVSEAQDHGSLWHGRHPALLTAFVRLLGIPPFFRILAAHGQTARRYRRYRVAQIPNKTAARSLCCSSSWTRGTLRPSKLQAAKLAYCCQKQLTWLSKLSSTCLSLIDGHHKTNLRMVDPSAPDPVLRQNRPKGTRKRSKTVSKLPNGCAAELCRCAEEAAEISKPVQ